MKKVHTVDFGNDGSCKTISEIIQGSLEKLQKRSMDTAEITGVPTGFKQLDQLTYGFQPSELVIVSGRPSMGKTSLVLGAALNAAKEIRDKRVLVFTLQMSNEQVVRRFMSSEAEINGKKFRTGLLDQGDQDKLAVAVDVIRDLDIKIDDTPALSIEKLGFIAKREHKDVPLSLIVVDYIQLVSGDSPSDRIQEIINITRGLKNLAKKLNVPVVAVSTLGRACDQRGDKRPQIKDLPENIDPVTREIFHIKTHYEKLFTAKGSVIKYCKFRIN